MGQLILQMCKGPHLRTSVGTPSACSAGDPGSIPGSGRSPGEGNGNPLQFWPGESHGQRSLVGYSPWGRKESDTAEQLTLHYFHKQMTIRLLQP